MYAASGPVKISSGILICYAMSVLVIPSVVRIIVAYGIVIPSVRVVINDAT